MNSFVRTNRRPVTRAFSWLALALVASSFQPAAIAGEQSQPSQAPIIDTALPNPVPDLATPPKRQDGYIPKELPVDYDPNVRNNYLPLDLNDFRVKTPAENGVPQGYISSVSRVVLADRGPINCVAVTVKVKNNTSDPIIVEGNKATTIAGGQNLTALSEDQALKVAGGQFTKNQLMTLAAVGVLTIGYCEPILQDRYTTSKTDWTKSYGLEERRRKVEAKRLSRRIVLPGEESEGVIVFAGSNTDISRVVLPMQTYPVGNDNGVLSLETKK